MAETIYKLQPHRTMQLQGFDGYGATAAMHDASDSGFTVSGVWGGQDDFAVLQLWDWNNRFEHPRARYLPDGDFSGLVLTFDIELGNCQAIDSANYPSVDWPYLNVLVGGGTAQYATEYQVPLRRYATPAGGSYVSATAQFMLGGAITAGDNIQVAWGSEHYYYPVGGGDTLASAVNSLAAAINAAPSPTVTASAAGAMLTLSYALTAGANGNLVGVYGTVWGGANTETWAPGWLQFSGGSSPAVWAVSLDFTGSAAGIADNSATPVPVPTTNVQRMWLTFAPDRQEGWPVVSDWWAIFTDWTVTDATGCRALQVAGPGSVRIEENSPWVTRTGFWDDPAAALLPDGVTADGWDVVSAWWSRGSAIRSAYSLYQARSLTVETHCGVAHTIYIGTRLDPDGGMVNVSVDGNAPVAVDCYGAGVQARVKIAAVAAGQHSVSISFSGGKNALSGGWYFFFDFLECAVLSDVPDPAETAGNVGVATDYDTDASYMVPPARLVWGIQKLGLAGEIDHYMGVFWWPVRKALEPVSTWSQTTAIPFAGTPSFTAGPTSLHMGSAELDHVNLMGDTAETVARALAMLVNQLSAVFWAEASGTVLTLHGRASSPGYYMAVTVDTHDTGFTAAAVTVNGTAPPIAAGWYWGVDETAANPINDAVAAWHADYFALLQAAGTGVTVSFSQELVNPPDNPPGAVWTQRFQDGTAAETATGFGVLLSSQCAFGTAVAAYMASAYAQVAALLAAAGLPVRLQFGEVLWWYQAGGSPASLAFYDADTAAAASAALGRALHTFGTPNDSPGVNAYADANFLRARLETYVDTVRTAVLAACPAAVFELLWPMDVNDPATAQLMRYVNLPAAWTARAGSGWDTFLVEGFQYGGVNHDVDRAKTCAGYPFTALTWDVAHCRYLMGLYYAAWPWRREYVAAVGTRVPLVKLWAYDHVCLFGWPARPVSLALGMKLIG